MFLDHFQPRTERLAAFWIVSSRDCPQEMGTDPWPCLKVRHFDDTGELVETDPSILFQQTVGQPVLIQVQGSLTTPDVALGGLLWTHSWLERNRAMLPGTVVIAFDWPSQRVYRNDVRDINEKGRRAYIAAYHLARFIQGFPPESRVCVLGQSYGGRVVPSALHLLGGGSLNSQSHDPEIALPTTRPDLHLRAIVLAGASDHTWLDPGARLDHALNACEGLLNLYNRRDEALRFYLLLFRSGHHYALGASGSRTATSTGSVRSRLVMPSKTCTTSLAGNTACSMPSPILRSGGGSPLTSGLRSPARSPSAQRSHPRGCPHGEARTKSFAVPTWRYSELRCRSYREHVTTTLIPRSFTLQPGEPEHSRVRFKSSPPVADTLDTAPFAHRGEGFQVLVFSRFPAFAGCAFTAGSGLVEGVTTGSRGRIRDGKPSRQEWSRTDEWIGQADPRSGQNACDRSRAGASEGPACSGVRVAGRATAPECRMDRAARFADVGRGPGPGSRCLRRCTRSR